MSCALRTNGAFCTHSGTQQCDLEIVRILQEGQSGRISQAELCRKHGISQGTYYVWKGQYSWMETDDVKRLRELEAENAALKRIVANQALELNATARLLRKMGFARKISAIRKNPAYNEGV